MAISYSDFLTQVRNYTEVDSNVLTDQIIQDFIKSVELDVAGKVDYDDLRKYATSNFTAGNRYVILPGDAIVVRSVQLIDSNNNRIFLEKRDTSYISEFAPNSSTTGTPKYWANWDEEYWVVAPTPDTAYEITMAFNKEPVSLTDATKSTSGTYISNKYPDLLLYASLVNTYGYLKGPQDMLQYYKAAYKEALESYAIEQIGQRRRSEYGDGVIRAQIISKSPSSN